MASVGKVNRLARGQFIDCYASNAQCLPQWGFGKEMYCVQLLHIQMPAGNNYKCAYFFVGLHFFTYSDKIACRAAATYAIIVTLR